MAFFLLGRVGDAVTLLSPDTFATRQDALTALSRITAEPEFDLWAAEVLLLDTDTGTPILLVRPNAAASTVFVEPLAEEELEIIVVDELDEEAPEADEEAPEADEEAPELDEEASDIAEAAPEVAEETPQTDEAAPEVAEEPGAVAEESLAVGDEAIADAIVEEYVFDEVPDSANALRDALTRTAAQMEAEGIVAPESIGSATVEVESDLEPEVEIAIEDELVIEADAEIAPEPEPVPEPELAESAAPATDTDLADLGEAAWPWDIAVETATPDALVEPDIKFVLNDLEEPSLDDGSILRGSIDDETFAASRPVIMGSYGESSAPPVELSPDTIAEPMGIVEAESAPPAPGTGFGIPVVGDVTDIFTLEPGTPETPELADEPDATADRLGEIPAIDLLSDDADDDDADTSISDFILDLDSIAAESAAPAEEPVTAEGSASEEPATAESATTADEAAVPAPDAGVLDGYTCADCVYEETCPNKDQRLPKDCGSFQWR